MGRIENIKEFAEVVDLATKFLICGTMEAQLPYDKVYTIRGKNRRLGLGLMGIHGGLLSKISIRSHSSSTNGYPFIEASLTMSAPRLQMSLVSASQWPTEQ